MIYHYIKQIIDMNQNSSKSYAEIFKLIDYNKFSLKNSRVLEELFQNKNKDIKLTNISTENIKNYLFTLKSHQI